jgi:hypothetical protein
MLRACVLTVMAIVALAAPAEAALRAGQALDPAEGSPHGDLARALVRYDDVAGSFELVADLHAAPEPGEPPTLLWQLAGPRTGSQCDASQGAASAEHAFAPGEAVLRFQRGEEEEIRVPAQVVVEQGGLRSRLTARDPRLAGLAFECVSLFATSGDDVTPFGLGTVAAPSPAPGGGTRPGSGSGPVSEDAPLYRFRRRTLTSVRRRDGRVDVTVRALVCGPVGRISVRVRYAIRRRGRPTFAPKRFVRLARVQRRRCQQHRLDWRIRPAGTGRYDVKADLSAERVAGRPPAATPPVPAS